jgi:hypothetical protein
MDLHVSHGLGSSNLARVGPDLFVPSPLTIACSDSAVPYDLELVVDVEDGIPVCRTLQVTRRDGGPPVTREGLRAVPVEKVMRLAAASVSLRASGRGDHYALEPAALDDQRTAWKGMQPRRGRAAEERTRLLATDLFRRYSDLRTVGVKQPKAVLREQLKAEGIHYSLSRIGALVAQGRKQAETEGETS